MISLTNADEVTFFDPEQRRYRHFMLCDNVTFEMDGGRIWQIISADPQEYTRYAHLIGKNIK